MPGARAIPRGRGLERDWQGWPGSFVTDRPYAVVVVLSVIAEVDASSCLLKRDEESRRPELVHDDVGLLCRRRQGNDR